VTDPFGPDPIGPFTVGRLPRMRFGRGSFAELPSVVAEHGRRALLVHGARSFLASPRGRALPSALEGQGVRLVGDVAIEGEPGIADVEDAVRVYRDLGVEVVIAIGGGSSLDAGKAIAGLLGSGTRLMDHLEEVGRGVPYPGPAIPVVAIPTTAGTGSEATRNAVITSRGPAGFKRSFRDERLVPVDALVDPDLLAGAPRPLIAVNGIDAVTQLIESSVALRASPFTDGLALRGLGAARDGLMTWYRDPDGPDAAAAREAMAMAALLSGICLANAGLGAVHGLASPLGGRLPIPHGAACGAILWQTVAANIEVLEARAPTSRALHRYAVIGRLLGGAETGVDDARARSALVDILRRWVTELEVPGLATFGLRHEAIDDIVAESSGGSTRTNPIELTPDERRAILLASL
jgi:alcohol dehydrogenase